MADIIIIVIVAIAVGSALSYIRKAKKSGARCVGCSDSGSCGSSCGCGCGSNAECSDYSTMNKE